MEDILHYKFCTSMMTLSRSVAENRLFLNQPEADVFWEGTERIAKQETQGLDNTHTHTYTCLWAC